MIQRRIGNAHPETGSESLSEKIAGEAADRPSRIDNPELSLETRSAIENWLNSKICFKAC